MPYFASSADEQTCTAAEDWMHEADELVWLLNGWRGHEGEMPGWYWPMPEENRTGGIPCASRLGQFGSTTRRLRNALLRDWPNQPIALLIEEVYEAVECWAIERSTENVVGALKLERDCKRARFLLAGIIEIIMSRCVSEKPGTEKQAEDGPRLRIDLESCTVTLDRQVFSGLDLNALRAFKAIWEGAPGQRRSVRWIRQNHISDCGHDTTFQRWIEALPDELKSLISKQPGAGTTIILPPRR